MLKRFIFVLVVLSTIAIWSESRAANFSLGVSSWYSWWDFRDNSGEKPIDPALMLGPVMSLGFNKEWSLSTVLLIGQFKMPGGSSGGSDMTFNRLDIDTTMNYSLSRYFKVFGGLKYMQYTGTGFYHRSLGPAFGVGLTAPLTDSLFFLANGSGIIMLGRHKNNDGKSVQKYKEPGFNTVLSLAYYVESMSTTINLGFRYQYFRTIYDKSTNGGNINHSFYGPTLSVVYSF